MRPYRINKIRFTVVCCLAVLLVVGILSPCRAQRRPRSSGLKEVQLPAPKTSGSVSLEEAINIRRSVRQFADKPLDYEQIGQLAWAGQGITDKRRGLRAAPSAGALYPIQLYFFTPEGLFVYRPEKHLLEQLSATDLRGKLSDAAGQKWVSEAGCDIVIVGEVRKLSSKYGNKARNFMLLEAGHVAQNIQLQAVTLRLASVPVGAFEVRNVSRICELSGNMEPLLIVCAGHPLVPYTTSTSQNEPSTDENTPKKYKNAVIIVPSMRFRDEELFETRRVLGQEGIATVIASSQIGPIRGMLGGLAASEKTLETVRVDDYDAVIFIGGTGAEEYYASQTAFNIAREAAAKNKVVAAISMAPTILANAGVLRNMRATGFITESEAIKKGGAEYTGAAVERDGLIITAGTPLATIQFAQAIAKALSE